MLSGGCFQNLPANIWRGFGEGLGFLPSQIISGYILDILPPELQV
jgi:hypothetical protein